MRRVRIPAKGDHAISKSLLVTAVVLALSACAQAPTISRDDLAAQAASDLTELTGDVTEVRCPDGVTLDADHTARLVCESRYDDYDWSEILVIVQAYDPETGAFETDFANPPPD